MASTKAGKNGLGELGTIFWDFLKKVYFCFPRNKLLCSFPPPKKRHPLPHLAVHQEMRRRCPESQKQVKGPEAKQNIPNSMYFVFMLLGIIPIWTQRSPGRIHAEAEAIHAQSPHWESSFSPSGGSQCSCALLGILPPLCSSIHGTLFSKNMLLFSVYVCLDPESTFFFFLFFGWAFKDQRKHIVQRGYFCFAWWSMVVGLSLRCCRSIIGLPPGNR